MITIISSTNRRNSEALHFATHCLAVFKSKTDEKVELLALENIAHDWFHPNMYSNGGQSDSLEKLQDAYILPAEKFFFIVPEYNGGFPGVLKLFLDGCSVREYKKSFSGKKAALVGIASGRAGNLRGMEHLTGVLNHVGTIVMPNKLPISSIENLMNSEGQVVDPNTLKIIEKQVEDFLAF